MWRFLSSIWGRYPRDPFSVLSCNIDMKTWIKPFLVALPIVKVGFPASCSFRGWYLKFSKQMSRSILLHVLRPRIARRRRHLTRRWRHSMYLYNPGAWWVGKNLESATPSSCFQGQVFQRIFCAEPKEPW